MYLKAALGLIPWPRPDRLPEVELSKVVRVDADHLAAYQRVCGNLLTERLPLGYPHILAFDLQMNLMTRNDFPFAVIGLVHITNRIEQERPLIAADEIELEAKVQDLREHPRGRQFDVITKAKVDGQTVWRESSTYLKVTRKAEKESREHTEPPAPHAIWRLPASVGPDYAKVSGDHNLIHTSRLGARIFGFPRPIAHGMYTMARCLAALDGRLPGKVTVDVSFKLPVLLPAKVGFRYSRNEFSLRDVKTGKPHVSGRIAA